MDFDFKEDNLLLKKPINYFFSNESTKHSRCFNEYVTFIRQEPFDKLSEIIYRNVTNEDIYGF